MKSIVDVMGGVIEAAGYKKKSYGSIISTKDKKAIFQIIDLWVSCFYEIERRFKLEGLPFDQKDDETYSLIGKSFCYLNQINSVIASKINSFLRYIRNECEKGGGKPCCEVEEYDSLLRYFKFFNNLSASRIKFVFFKESPVKSLNYPILNISKKYADAAFDLVGYLNRDENKIRLSELSYRVSNYCLLQELMYSFVYRDDKKYGIFLRFDLLPDAYMSISKDLRACVEEFLDDEKDNNLKYFFAKVSCVIFSYYVLNGLSLRESNDSVYSKDDLDDKVKKIRGLIIGDNLKELPLTKKMWYKSFYELFVLLEGDLYVEPITYQLYDILWKIHGMIDITDKSVNHNEYREKRRLIKKNVRAFVLNYLKMGEKMYNKKKLSFSDLYLMGSALFDENMMIDEESNGVSGGLNKLIFKEHSILDVEERMNRLRGVEGIVKKEVYVGLDKNGDDIYDIESKEEDDFKLDNLIQRISTKNLLDLLYGFAVMVQDRKQLLGDGQYIVGFYKAGIFLAHIINLTKEIGERSGVWLFNTKPYVATHPIHTDDNIDGIYKIVLIDDSIKTGFTYSLYDSYLKRNAVSDGLGRMSVKLFALFDYKYYERLRVITNNDYYGLLGLRRDYGVIKVRDDKEMSDNYQYGFKYKFKDVNEILNAIKDKEGAVDLSFFLTDTDALLSICFSFINEIADRLKKKQRKKIVLYSPTPNGEVILLMCAFLLKTVYNETFEVAGVSYNKSEEDYLVALDLSLVTGFSIMYNWSLMKEVDYEMNEDDMEQMKTVFDMVAVVYCSCQRCVGVERKCNRCNGFVFSLNH